MVNEDKEKKIEASLDENRDISQLKKSIEEKKDTTSFLQKTISSLKKFIIGKEIKESSVDNKKEQTHQEKHLSESSSDLAQDLLSLKESALVTTEIANHILRCSFQLWQSS
jgi:hypothetical protein